VPSPQLAFPAETHYAEFHFAVYVIMLGMGATCSKLVRLSDIFYEPKSFFFGSVLVSSLRFFVTTIF
jgi:hypothetical protein